MDTSSKMIGARRVVPERVEEEKGAVGGKDLAEKEVEESGGEGEEEEEDEEDPLVCPEFRMSFYQALRQAVSIWLCPLLLELAYL